MSLRAVLSRKDTGTVWRSSLQACEGIAHLHLQQVQVSAEDRRLAEGLLGNDTQFGCGWKPRYDLSSSNWCNLLGMWLMAAQWFVLKSKPNKEDLLWDQLLVRQIETFYPRIRYKAINPRSRKMRPFFPGYLFVRVETELGNMSSLNWIPGAARVVTFGGEPATVPEGLIHAIQRKVEEVNAAGGELFDGLKSGDVVYIQDGPFAGYEAIFDAHLPGSERVRVLLKLLQKRQMPVNLPAGQIRRKNRR